MSLFSRKLRPKKSWGRLRGLGRRVSTARKTKTPKNSKSAGVTSNSPRKTTWTESSVRATRRHRWGSETKTLMSIPMPRPWISNRHTMCRGPSEISTENTKSPKGTRVGVLKRNGITSFPPNIVRHSPFIRPRIGAKVGVVRRLRKIIMKMRRKILRRSRETSLGRVTMNPEEEEVTNNSTVVRFRTRATSKYSPNKSLRLHGHQKLRRLRWKIHFSASVKVMPRSSYSKKSSLTTINAPRNPPSLGAGQNRNCTSWNKRERRQSNSRKRE